MKHTLTESQKLHLAQNFGPILNAINPNIKPKDFVEQLYRTKEEEEALACAPVMPHLSDDDIDALAKEEAERQEMEERLTEMNEPLNPTEHPHEAFE